MVAFRIAWALATLALVATPTTGTAQQEDWDQAAVTGNAKELPPLIDAIRAELRTRSVTLGSGDSRDYHRLAHGLRRIRTEARHLVAALEEGKGHDETLPSYEHMLLLIRDAREVAARIFRTEPLMDRIRAARAALERLAPYYDAAPLPPALQR